MTIIDKKNRIIKILLIIVTNKLDLTEIEKHKLKRYNEIKNNLSYTYRYKEYVIPFFISWDGLVAKRMGYCCPTD